MNFVSKGLNILVSLLSASSSQCLTCGKQGRQSVISPAICVNCERLIPWIRFPRCQICGRHVGCPDCTRDGHSSPIQCNRSAVAYNPVMREWLGQYKYRGNERYAPLLGLMLEEAYRMMKEERNTISWTADLLVPVPVSNSRLLERGFNQAERLAVELSRRTGIPVLPLLIRTHHTGKQSFKGRAERLADMKHAFAPNTNLHEDYRKWLTGNTAAFSSLDPSINSFIVDKKQTRPVRIVIVDDIYTTGSTLRACAESLRQFTESMGSFKSEIYALTWARS